MIDEALHVSELVSRLSDCGKRVQFAGPSPVSEARIAKFRMSPVSAALSIRQNDFTNDNFFWMFLVGSDGDECAVGARREVLARGDRIPEFWDRCYARYFHSSNVAHQKVDLSWMGARLVYTGDLYKSEGARGSVYELNLFIRLFFMTILNKWDPDSIYAFMRKRDIERGFGARYGFTVTIPKIREWSNPPEGRSDSEYLIALPRMHYDIFLRAKP